MGQVLCGDRWMSLVQNDDGKLFVQMGDSVLIVPVTASGDVLLITETSLAYGARTLILPSGELEPGEDSADAANRELQEEVGYRAEQITALGELRPISKYVHTRCYVHLAQGLQPSHLDGDEDEIIEVEPVALAQFEALIDQGRLQDSSTIAALYLARRYLQKQVG